jgi:hypothetical protein
VKWMVILTALTTSQVALAADPVHLACNGGMRVVNANNVVAENYTVSLAIDLQAGTLTVDGYEPVQIVDDRGDTVVFEAKPETKTGVSTGTLNRITGAASIHIIKSTRGLHIFEGTCKRGEKLF